MSKGHLDCVIMFNKFLLILFLDYFDVLISKIIFKNKKYYFKIFFNNKYF